MTARLLVLGGTAEARALAAALTGRGVPALVSLAGATEAPAPQGAPVRRGGFGGAEGFRDCLRTTPVRAVIDATHPFAARIGPRSAGICAEEGVPYLRLLRPPWRPAPGDDWHEAQGLSDLPALIPPGRVVFCATGGQSLSELSVLAGRRCLVRIADPPRVAPPEGVETLVGLPLAEAAAEAALFRRLGVDWLVARNAGGPARAKLDAARELGLPVALLARPPVPAAPRVETVAEALDWAAAL